MSVDSGFQQTESSQNLGGKQQVRIAEPEVKADGTFKEGDSDSALGEAKTDGMEFESNVTLREFEIEVSEQLLDRCATQLSTNEKIVGGRKSRDSAGLGTVRHLAVIKNEYVYWQTILFSVLVT